MTDYGVTLDALLSRTEQVRGDLDGRAAVEADDGHRIAMRIDGVATPRPNEPMIDLIANVGLTTASRKYAWVDTRQNWSVAVVSLVTARIHVDSFMQ